MGFFTLWEKEFKKGTVTLGGNANPPATGQGSNYFVLVMPGEMAIRTMGKLSTTWSKLKNER
jgi:hypothetical protein